MSGFKRIAEENAWWWLWLATFLAFGKLIWDTVDAVIEHRKTGGSWKKFIPKCLLDLAIFLVALVGALGAQWSSEALEKRSPINSPVSTITGNVIVNLSGPLDGYPGIGVHLDSWMEMTETNLAQRSIYLGPFQVMTARDILGYESRSSGPVARGYSMAFEPNPMFAPGFTEGRIIADNSPLTPAVIINRITSLRFRLAFIPPESEVLSGSAVITINGAFQMRFQFKPQRSTIHQYITATILN